MITTKKELKEYLSYEKKLYNLRFFDYITGTQKVASMKYVRLLRICEYYKNQNNAFSILLFTWNRIRKNRLGKKLGIEIGENSCGKGLLIYHSGSIVINGNSIIGENLSLHGNNCIGNSGANNDCPRIGNNVELGVGATIIGNVTLGNNIKIGSNATCVKDCLEDNVTLVGTPAKIIHKS